MTHTPVLLKEAIEILNPQPGEFFIDGTIGGGGHAIEITKRIEPNGILLGIDWDKEAIQRFKVKGLRFKNLILVQGNYADLPEILEKHNLPKADGLLLDLGMSSDQLENSGRGFSFLRNEPLDMRYNHDNGATAAGVVNSFSEKDLAEIFWQYGGEKFSRLIAKKIIEERRNKRILTTFDLVEAVKKSTPRNYERGRIHPATRTFQALRIYVNDELGNLETLLQNLCQIIRGRAAIISFHSLEDRLVKNYFRQMAKEGMAEILTKKPIRPTNEEIQANPRSRSAKLRAIIFNYCL